MRETIPLENAIDKVHEISQNNFDEVIPVRAVIFESFNVVKNSGHLISFGTHSSENNDHLIIWYLSTYLLVISQS